MVKEVFFMAGVWDLFHVGHLRYIREGRRLAGDNQFIIGVVTDQLALEYKGHLPIIPYSQRFEIINAFNPDYTVRYEKQFDVEHMQSLGVTTMILDTGWQEKMPPELREMMEHINVVFIPRTDWISSAAIKERIRGGASE